MTTPSANQAATLTAAASRGRTTRLPVSCAQKAQMPKKATHSSETAPSQVMMGQSSSSPQRASAASAAAATSTFAASSGSSPASAREQKAASRLTGSAP